MCYFTYSEIAFFQVSHEHNIKNESVTPTMIGMFGYFVEEYFFDIRTSMVFPQTNASKYK